MAELAGTLQAALTSARKAQDKDRTVLLGTILAAVRNRELELPKPLSDTDVLEVLARGIKQRREAAEQFTVAGRQDLADRELVQATVLEEFLPPQADPEEVRGAVRELIAGGTAAVGPLMAALVPRYKGRLDGKVLNQIVREELPPG